jgi:hypothetical protein
MKGKGTEIVFQALESSEQEHSWDSLRRLIKDYVLGKSNTEIDELLGRLEARANKLEQEASLLRSSENSAKCQELYALARRFNRVRYVVYDHLKPDWLPLEHRRGHPDFTQS